jgi:transposase-like protein
MPRPKKSHSPFRYFNSSPEVIRLVVLMYVRFPLSLRNVEDLLAERGVDICHETVRHWWNRFGPRPRQARLATWPRSIAPQNARRVRERLLACQFRVLRRSSTEVAANAVKLSATP